MDSSRFLDSARDPYARRQTPSMALSSSLSSGQAYYTVESLEGASSLPPLKSGFTFHAPPGSERDDILRLERALLAERETLDARSRLLAVEKEDLLRRNVADQIAFADGLRPVDTRTRLDGLPPSDARRRLLLDELQALDSRSRVHGLERPNDAMHPVLDGRARALGPVGGLGLGADERESIRFQDLATAGARPGAASFLPQTNYQRDIADVRAPLDSLTRRGLTGWPSASSAQPQIERPYPISRQEPAALRPAPMEAPRKQNKSVTSGRAPLVKPKAKPPPEKSVTNVKTTSAKPTPKPVLEKSITNVKTPPVKPVTKPPPDQSEGWCAVCHIDCHNVKTLGIHIVGKKHRSMYDGNTAKALAEGKSTPAVAKQADKKRASDAKPEASQSAKRPKISALANGAPTADTRDGKRAKADDSTKKADEKTKAKNAVDNTSMLSCVVCNIVTSGPKNLESHLKGKRHAARVKELANS